MRHISVTNKQGDPIILHCEDIIEVFAARDRCHSIIVVRVQKKDGDGTFLMVNETPRQIWEMLTKLNYCPQDLLQKLEKLINSRVGSGDGT